MMPYGAITRPSIALGVLKARLVDGGIACAIHYANLDFAAWIGLDALRLVDSARTESLIGEWTFAGAAFPERTTTVTDILGRAHVERLRETPAVAGQLAEIAEVYAWIRQVAPCFVDTTARRLLARGPRIVGCSSTFEQHCASLALLRRIKALDPSVITMLGGANCEAEMGWATLRAFPWVDVVVSGEADDLILPLCRRLLEDGPGRGGDLPDGVLVRSHVREGRYGRGGRPVPRAVVDHLDGVPLPEYDDYFTALARSPLRDEILPALPVETSRGCWWGQKSQCTFCGLNGTGMAYRSKSPERVGAEFAALAGRHGVSRLQVVDNILDMRHLRTVLPDLARAGAPYQLFYEIKANLRRDQVATLAAAGVTKVQPGIEALHDDLLALMAKGNTAAINVQLLRYAREHGVSCVWLFLAGFPGEDDRWHEEVAGWLPLIYHLQPPTAVVRVRYDRFSVYHQHPERHGLRLRPLPAYATVYPVDTEALDDLAYFFVDETADPSAATTPGIDALNRRLAEWRRCFAQPLRPVLSVIERDGALDLLDTRPCAAQRRTTLHGLDAEVYRACDPATGGAELARRLAPGGARAEAVHAALARLVDLRLVLALHGKYLALGVAGEQPPFHAPAESPGGWLRSLERPLVESLQRALERVRDAAATGDEPAPELAIAPGGTP
jgi:magnesium-protoporphyrin IX monomethyl ester (oxidative) cyclase